MSNKPPAGFPDIDAERFLGDLKTVMGELGKRQSEFEALAKEQIGAFAAERTLDEMKKLEPAIAAAILEQIEKIPDRAVLVNRLAQSYTTAFGLGILLGAQHASMEVAMKAPLAGLGINLKLMEKFGGIFEQTLRDIADANARQRAAAAQSPSPAPGKAS